MIQQMILDALTPYSEQLSQQEKEITELRRCLKNINRVGVVSAVSPDHDRIKVKFGENETPFIKWFCACCGDVAEYREPSVGEQAVLINVGGGDNSSTSIALTGVSSDRFPLPTNNPDEILRIYPDGTRFCYNKNQSQLDIHIAGDATVNIAGKATVSAGDQVTVDAAKILLNGGAGVVTGDHKCMVTGKPHGDCSKTVFAGK